MPPGLADADDRPPRRRIPVIDGEVTGEFPAFVDGEVTGEMPAVGTPSRRRGGPGAEPPRQRPASGPPPRGPAPPGLPPGPFPPGPPPPAAPGYGESPFGPPGLEPDKPDKKAKKKVKKDRKRRDKGRRPETDLPTEPPHAPGSPRPSHGQPMRPAPPGGPMPPPPGGPMPPEPPGPPGPVLARSGPPPEELEKPQSTRVKPPSVDKSSKRGKPRVAKGEPPPADALAVDEHGLDKRSGRARDASLARPRRPRLGGRSQLRAQLRQTQRLRLLTIAFVALVLLGSLPGFLLIRYATRDPGFRAMDALELPGWAARDPVDQARGSRWCLRECRVRHRMWESERAPQPTVEAYQRALRGGGWKRWEVSRCPPWKVRGDYTCWRRDAYTLDLWIRGPECRGDTEQCPGAVVTVVIRNAGADARLQ